MKPVSKATLAKMREAYKKNIQSFSTDNLKKKFPERAGIEEASSAWVSRKDLETLLNANNADGLRIYYGCHHESTHKDSAMDYHGLHNVIFVATKDSVDSNNPTFENSVDQLNDSEEKPVTDCNLTQQDYAGSGGDAYPLCPPSCPK
ncbi:MAG TPA: hypothetical protein VN726_20570 [Hanamia sp.]|nr:hypothetical protein [Hanamia sp.]